MLYVEHVRPNYPIALHRLGGAGADCNALLAICSCLSLNLLSLKRGHQDFV